MTDDDDVMQLADRVDSNGITALIGRQRCSRCKEFKELSEFYRDKSRKSGFSNKCKPCSTAVARQWTKDNPEETRRQSAVRGRRWRIENEEYSRQYQATWYQENLEQARAKRAQWRVEHPDYEKERYAKNGPKPGATKAWRRENPERSRQLALKYVHKRRALKQGAPSEPYTTADIVARDGSYCGLCGGWIDQTLVYPDLMRRSVDHVIPLSRGGTDLFSNVQLTHLRCNLSKQDRIQGEF